MITGIIDYVKNIYNFNLNKIEGIDTIVKNIENISILNENKILNLNNEIIQLKGIPEDVKEYLITSYNTNKFVHSVSNNPIIILNYSNSIKFKDLYTLVHSTINKEIFNNEIFDNISDNDKKFMVCDIKKVSDRLIWDECILKEYVYHQFMKNNNCNVRDEDLILGLAYKIYNYSKSRSLHSVLKTNLDEVKFSRVFYNSASSLVKSKVYLNTILNNRRSIFSHFYKVQIAAWFYAQCRDNRGNNGNWYISKDVSEDLTYKLDLYNSDSISNFNTLCKDINFVSENFKNSIREILMVKTIAINNDKKSLVN